MPQPHIENLDKKSRLHKKLHFGKDGHFEYFGVASKTWFYAIWDDRSKEISKLFVKQAFYNQQIPG